MSSNSTVLLARNVLHLGLGQVATTAIGIASAAVIGRALGPADFGVLYVVFTICAFVGVIADWGQGNCLIREVARGRSDERELIGAALLIRLASTSCATVLAGAVAIGFGYDKQVVLLTLLAMIVGFPTIVSAPYGLTFRAKNRMEIDALAGVLSKASALAATVIALRLGGGLKELVLMQGVGAIAALMVVLYFVARHDLKIKFPTSIAASDIFWGGLPVVAFSLVISSQPFLEALIISALTAPAVVGWYGASRTISGIILSPAMILVGASFPEFSRAAQSIPHLRQMIEGTSRVLCMIAAFIASFLYLFSDHLITIIYGHGRFEQAADILRVNAVFVPLLFFVMLLSSTLWALGRSNAMVAISLARVSFCAIASWFLIGFFQERMGNGAIGLVIIGGMAEVPAIVACLAVLPRGVVGNAVILNFVRAYVAAIGVVVIVSFLEPLTLLYTAATFILTFAIVATATRLVLLSDLRVAVNIARSKIFSR